MKKIFWDVAEKVAIVSLLIALLLSIVGLGRKQINYREECENQGGVVVNSYKQDNCWVNGQFVKI